jgi:hypothetical protein
MGLGGDNQGPSQNKRAIEHSRAPDGRLCKASGIVKKASETAKLSSICQADDTGVLAISAELSIRNAVRECRTRRKQFVCISLQACDMGRTAQRAVSDGQPSRMIILASGDP